MRRQAKLLVSLIFVFFAFCTLKAQQQQDIIFSPEELQWIADNPEVRLGYDPEWAPFEWHDEVRGFAGLSSGYIKYIEKVSGLHFVPIKYATWPKILEALKNGDLDMVSAINPSPERKTYLDFTSPYFTTPSVYVTRKGKALDGGLAAYNGLKVGVVKGYNTEMNLRQMYPKVKFVAFNNVESGLVALAVGEISAFSGSLAVINYMIENKGILGLEVAGQTAGIERFHICMACRKSLTPLDVILNKALVSMPEVQRHKLNKRWINLQAVRSTVLTHEEKEWITAHPVITSYIQNSPPYHYWDDGPAGISVELLEMISSKYGFNVKYDNTLKFIESITHLQNDTMVGMLPLVENTPERRKYLSFTDDFASDASVVFMPAGAKEIFSLYDLKGKSLAMPKGSALLARVKELRLGVDIVEYTSRLECLSALDNEDVDAYLGNLMMGRYLMLHHNLDNIKVAAPSIWAPQKFAFAVSKDNAILASILNKGLAGISQEERASLYLEHYAYVANKMNYRPFFVALIIALFMMAFILLLNWQLHQRVAKRTSELNAALDRRKEAEEELQIHNGKLEEEVEHQVSEIKTANSVTKKALELAHAGTWFYNAETAKDAYVFSCELFEILGESAFSKEGPIPAEYWNANLLKTNVESGSESLAFIADLMVNPDLEPHLIYQYTRPVDGKRIWVEATAEAERDANGVIIWMKGLARDITAEKQEGDELLRVNALSQNALSLSNSGTWYVDYNNPEYYHASDDDIEMKGLWPQKNNEYHIINDWYKNLLAADSEMAKSARITYQEALAGISDLDVTYLFKRPIDGEIIWLREKADIVRDEHGEILFMYGVTQDITHQKEQEAKKERELQRIISMQEIAKIGSWYIDFEKDPDKIISDENQVSVQGEIVGSPIGFSAWGQNLVDIGDREGYAILNIIKEKLADPNCFEWSGEYEYVRPIDGKKIWVRTIAFTSRDEDGRPIYIHGISQDITEQKLQVLEVDQSQKRLQSLFDNMPNGFAEHEIVLNEDGEAVDYRFLYVNAAFTQQTGMGASVIGRTMNEIAPGVNEVWIQRYGKVALTGEACTFEEYSLALNRHYRVYAFSNQKGHFATLFDDITLQQEQQQEIKTINNVLAFAQTVAGVGHFEFFPVEDRVKCSEEYYKIFGVSADQIIGMESFLSFIVPEDVDIVLKAMKNAIDKQIPLEMTFRITGEEGVKYIHEQGNYEFDEHGTAIYFMGTAQDITELKRSETKMQEQHHFLQALLNSMPDIVFSKNLDGVFSLANHQFEQYIGKTSAQIIGKRDEDIFDKEHANINTQMDKIVYREGKNITYEEMVSQENGEERLYEKTKTPITDSEGNIIGIIGMGRDITEKRKTEVEILNKEKSFRNLFEQSNDAILIIDIIENNFLDCNDALVKLVGLSSKSDIFKMAIGDFSPEYQSNGELSLHVIKEVKTLAISTGHAKRQYELVNQRTGERVFCNLSFNKTEFKSRRVIQVIARDITDLKDAENVLKESKKHIEEILNTIPIGISVIDRKSGKSILMNKTNKDMFELDDVEVVDFNDALIYHKESDLKEVKAQLESTGVLENKELELIRTKSGERFWAVATSSRREFFDTDATLVCLYDTTLLKQTQFDLETAKQEADAANIAKSAFLANMSHEIRTPMNAIIGFSEILNRKIVDDEQRRHLSSIQSSGKTLLKLINNILDLSKIEAGKMDLLYDFVNVNQLLSELRLLFEARAHEKGLVFDAVVSDGFPCSIEVDELRLRQVAINLLGNAVKFTRDGFVRIEFSAEDLNSESMTLVIKVSDSGIGIAKSKIDEVFNDFTQEDSSTTRNFGGTGLGLSISKNIVKLFGGKIHADSEVDCGASFTVEIPNVKYSDEQISIGELNGINPMTVEFEPAKLLIVDDVKSNRDVLQAHLDIYSFDLYFASNGHEAVDMAKGLQPDLILMDMRMPVMDGYEATRLMSEDDRTKNIPIVACTASAFKTSEEEILNLGFSGYLRKPVLVRSLISEMSNHLKYRLIDDVSDSDVEGLVEFTEVQKAKRSDIIHDLNEIKETYWLPLEKSQNMRKVKSFGEALIQFNERYQFDHIDHYNSALSSAIDNFDVEDIKMLIASFSKLVNGLNESA